MSSESDPGDPGMEDDDSGGGFDESDEDGFDESDEDGFDESVGSYDEPISFDAGNNFSPPARPLIEESLDVLFEDYYGDVLGNPNLTPREAFAQVMIDHGVNFPEVIEEPSPYREGNPNFGQHVIIAEGQQGCEATAVSMGIDYVRGFLGGERDPNGGFRLINHRERDDGRIDEAARPVAAGLGDTDDSKGQVKSSIPDAASEFRKALLNHYDSQLEGGGGSEPWFSGLPKLLEDDEFLAWMLQNAATDNRSIIEIRGGAGGASGACVIALGADLNRHGLIGFGNSSVGFTVAGQLGRFSNDVRLDVDLPNGETRFSWDDEVALLDFIHDTVESGAAEFILYIPNTGATFSYWATRANASYNEIRDFQDPIRQEGNVLEAHRDLAHEPQFNDLSHADRDRVYAESTFAWRRLCRREPWVWFSRGDEHYDRGEQATDFFGSAMTVGFDGVTDDSELENRQIPGVRGVNTDHDALLANSKLAANLLNAPVMADEITAAYPVVFREGCDMTLGHLTTVEGAVASELGLSAGDVDAISMDLEGGSAQHPLDYETSVTVFAQIDSLPLAVHEEMSTDTYRMAVNRPEEVGRR